MSVWVPSEEMVRSSEAGVISGCEGPEWALGTELRSSTRVVPEFPAPAPSLVFSISLSSVGPQRRRLKQNGGVKPGGGWVPQKESSQVPMQAHG